MKLYQIIKSRKELETQSYAVTTNPARESAKWRLNTITLSKNENFQFSLYLYMKGTLHQAARTLKKLKTQSHTLQTQQKIHQRTLNTIYFVQN